METADIRFEKNAANGMDAERDTIFLYSRIVALDRFESIEDKLRYANLA